METERERKEIYLTQLYFALSVGFALGSDCLFRHRCSGPELDHTYPVRAIPGSRSFLGSWSVRRMIGGQMEVVIVAGRA